jgi:enoyl-CoA hydratase/carnithine racemase
MSDHLDVTQNDEILEIVLDRPKANAIDAPLSREMGAVFAGFRDDPKLRVAILAGVHEDGGKRRCAGGRTSVCGKEEARVEGSVTFDQLESTVRWRAEMSDRLRRGKDSGR